MWLVVSVLSPRRRFQHCPFENARVARVVRVAPVAVCLEGLVWLVVPVLSPRMRFRYCPSDKARVARVARVVRVVRVTAWLVWLVWLVVPTMTMAMTMPMVMMTMTMTVTTMTMTATTLLCFVPTAMATKYRRASHRVWHRKGARRGKAAAHNTVHSMAARSTAQIIKAANGVEHCQFIVQPSHRQARTIPWRSARLGG